jgi:hypothetical protein
MAIRRTLQAAAIAATCVSVPVGVAHAQLTFSAGGGATWPLSTLGDSYKTGYNLLAALGIGMPAWPVNLRIDGMFNQMHSAPGVSAGTLQMWTVNANVVWNIVPGKGVTPYLIGGAGYYNDSYNVSLNGSSVSSGGNVHNNSFGINGGAGLRFGISTLSLFVESRYHYVFQSAFNPQFIPVTVGITF